MLLKSEEVHVLSLFDYVEDEIGANCTLNFVMICAWLFYYNTEFKHIDR